MIEVTNLTKKYGDHVAVDHLSFRVEQGQVYGFLGPNGAGKSTTMNIMTGYLAATEGTVKIAGKDIQKEPEEAKKHIGYLPELPPVYTDMTVEEYLKFAAELKRIPKNKRSNQIQKVMEMTQITATSSRLIRNLSKGYKQRVGLAQAILGFPEVIILDEPTVGLDPKQIIEIRDLIRELGNEHTIILSSHILSEVSAVCDHIMIIAHGKLVASDSPEGLQKRIRNSSSLELEVQGTYENVSQVLQGISKVEKVEKKGITEEGCVKLTLTARDNMDAREEIFYALAQAKLPIYEMTKTVKSLEDIFLELTQDNATSHSIPKKKGLSGLTEKYNRKKKTQKHQNIVDETQQQGLSSEQNEEFSVSESRQKNLNPNEISMLKEENSSGVSVMESEQKKKEES